MTKTLTNEEGLELIVKRRAIAVPTSLTNLYEYSLFDGRAWIKRSYSIDTREVILFKEDYYVRTKTMDYEHIVLGIAYGKDGDRREVRLMEIEENELCMVGS